ncbi:protein of unknown function [Streptomyces murinus]
MFTGNPVNTLKSGTVGGIVRPFTASSLCLFQRNHVPAVMTGDGVSTYLALTFGTLLSSQGTVASFVLTLSGFPPGFPSCFRLYQIFPIRFPRRFPGSRFRVSLSGGSDFIRSSESDFPPGPGHLVQRVKCWGSQPGEVVNVLERGAPMQIEAPRSRHEPTGRQTSTTTGRIIGLRR